MERREPSSEDMVTGLSSHSPLENRGQRKELSSRKDEGQGQGEDTTEAHQAEAGNPTEHDIQGLPQTERWTSRKTEREKTVTNFFLPRHARSVLLKI